MIEDIVGILAGLALGVFAGGMIFYFLKTAEDARKRNERLLEQIRQHERSMWRWYK